MPSRRIVSSPNLAPVQDNAVNPFGSFNSDTINKLTRVVSKGLDGVICGLEVRPIIQPTYIEKVINLPINLQSVKSSGVEQVSITDEHGNVTYLNQYDVSNMSTNNIDYSEFKLAYIEYNLDNEFFQSYYGKNITKEFEFTINILSGNPKQIIAFINNDIELLDYPRYTGYSCAIRVKHNFLNNSKENPLIGGLKFNLDILDEKCQYSETSDGKTYIRITAPSSIKVYDISTTLDTDDYVTNHTIDGNVSIDKIHPMSTFEITKGMAIKDDVLLSASGIFNSNISSIVRLDISDPKSWIKENPYTEQDFGLNGSQTLQILNGSHASGEASIDPSTGKLQASVYISKDEEVTINQTDDYQLCPWDKKIDIYKADNGIIDGEQCIKVIIEPQQIKYIHGNQFLLYYKDSFGHEKVFKKVIVPAELDGNGLYTTIKYEFNFNISEIGLSNIDINNIYCVQSGGPVKVSGSIGEYNKDYTKIAHVVCYYSYFKHPEPNVAYYGLIRDEDLNDLIFREDYLVLASLRLTDAKTFDIISYDLRQTLTLPSKINATEINYSNSLTSGEEGFYELDCWKKLPKSKLENGDVPSTVSKALTELAYRRLSDINSFNEKIHNVLLLIDGLSKSSRENEFLIRNISQSGEINNNILINKFDEGDFSLWSYSNADQAYQYVTLCDLENNKEYKPTYESNSCIRWKTEDGLYAICDIPKLCEHEEYLNSNLKFINIHNEYTDYKYFLCEINKFEEIEDPNIKIPIINYNSNFQYVSNQIIPVTFRNTADYTLLSLSVSEIDDNKYETDSSALQDIINPGSKSNLVKSAVAILPPVTEDNQGELITEDNEQSYVDNTPNQYLLTYNQNSKSKLDYCYIKEKESYNKLSVSDVQKYINELNRINSILSNINKDSDGLVYCSGEELEVTDIKKNDIVTTKDIFISKNSKIIEVCYDFSEYIDPDATEYIDPDTNESIDTDTNEPIDISTNESIDTDNIRVYTKSYTMQNNGSLFVSFRNDCSPKGILGYQIFYVNEQDESGNTKNEILIDQRIFNGKQTDTNSVNTNLTFNLESGLSFRFYKNEDFEFKEEYFLDYRECYNETKKENE